MTNRIAVLGLGNILLRDEGVGVRFIEILRQSYAFAPEIALIDGGTLGLELHPFLEGRDKVLVVDAVDFGKEPGYIDILEGDQIGSLFKTKLSVHHIGFADVLDAARMTGIAMPEICLTGVQPKSVDVGLELSFELSARIDALMEVILGRLALWGIEATLRKEEIS
jgi:hydrogenase maturation protease